MIPDTCPACAPGGECLMQPPGTLHPVLSPPPALPRWQPAPSLDATNALLDLAWRIVTAHAGHDGENPRLPLALAIAADARRTVGWMRADGWNADADVLAREVAGLERVLPVGEGV